MRISRATLAGLAVCGALTGSLGVTAAPALAAAPVTPTLSVETPVHATEAVVHGVLSPGAPGEAGSLYQFLYKEFKQGETPDCEGGAAAPESPGIAVGEENEAVNETLFSLQSGTKYAVCLRVENLTSEVAKSATETFTTAIPPETPVTREAKSITASSAVLNGELNPNASATASYEFEYNVGASCEGGVTTTVGAEKTGKGIEVSEAVTGLEGSTEYTFCVVALNNAGEPVPGLPSSFTTLPAEPAVVGGSEKTSGVTPFEATLEAEVNPENQNTTVYFQYSTSSALKGESLATPTAVPAAPGTSIGSGSGAVPVSISTGHKLAPGTTYYYQAVAVDGTGTTYGKVESFPTSGPAEKPHVESESSSGVTPFAVTLEATVNPEFQATTCTFEYGTVKAAVEAGHGTSVPCPKALGSGSGGVGVSVAVSGLTPKTPYFYRISATNATGTEPGATETFETLTLEKPHVESESASGVTPFAVTLEATVNPEFQEATCTFEYGTVKAAVEAGHGTPVPCPKALGSGSGGVGASVAVSGLTPKTPYFYRISATNATGTEPGATETFETLTLEKPHVESESASGVTPFAVTLEATVNPEFQEATCTFEYGTVKAAVEAGHGTPVPCPKALGSGSGGVGASVAVSGLTPKTPYFYRISATNATGTEPGATEEFKTLTLEAPKVESESVSGVTEFGAKLEAQVNPDYQATTTEFEYSTEESVVLEGKGAKVPGPGITANGGAQLVSVDLGNVLLPRTTYYYRVVAANATGTVENTGAIRSFKTLTEAIVTTGEAQRVTSSTAVFAGATVNPEGSETKYHFAYVPVSEYQPGTADPYANGRRTPESSSVGSDYTAHGIGPILVSELQPGTSYDYALIATNAQEVTTIGPNQTFTTAPSAPPVAITGGVAGLTQTSAVITGAVNTQGLPTKYEFEFGTTPGMGTPVPAVAGTVVGTTVSFSASLAGSLQPGTTYYYRVLATSVDGAGYGAVQSFTTGSLTGLPGVTSVPLVNFTVSQTTTTTQPRKEIATKPQKCAKGKKRNAKGKCVAAKKTKKAKKRGKK